MTPLRIMHVVVSDRFAGVEQFVRRLAVEQAEAGHEVWVAGGDPARMAGPLRDARVRFTPVTSTPEAVRAIRSVGLDLDVVNSHMTAADAAAVTAKAAGCRAALVSTRHFALPRGTRGPSVPYRVVERMLDAEISISHAVAGTIGVPSTVVHPGVPDVPAPAQPRTRSVLMAQRLQPEKDSELGVRAFAASGIADDGWTLDIAGRGPQRERLQQLAAQLGVAESVRLLGFRDDLPELMSRAGMLLASAPFEHFGLTVLEAMSAGLPVVATDAAGHAEMLAPVPGNALFPPGDATAASALLRRLADDDAARDGLGAAQRERQRKAFALRGQAEATERVYLEAIAR
ncbi:glycosyltransferase [Microbacterium bovistercoris]|uniref:Glycosyltransferase n=1 Tax=Microbacterium bovistercoris TaxID=2293570 RepID=A0A371NZ91_9MICO|nr:glycosyltransferase family 4 protein [Microbacterium bovistercoris]REJ08023.1 glycosyltransferase [Microbacterium bovistercoris]